MAIPEGSQSSVENPSTHPRLRPIVPVMAEAAASANTPTASRVDGETNPSSGRAATETGEDEELTRARPGWRPQPQRAGLERTPFNGSIGRCGGWRNRSGRLIVEFSDDPPN